MVNVDSDILLAHVKLLRLHLCRCLPSEIAVVIRRLKEEQGNCSIHDDSEGVREYQLFIDLLEQWWNE